MYNGYLCPQHIYAQKFVLMTANVSKWINLWPWPCAKLWSISKHLILIFGFTQRISDPPPAPSRTTVTWTLATSKRGRIQGTYAIIHPTVSHPTIFTWWMIIVFWWLIKLPYWFKAGFFVESFKYFFMRYKKDNFIWRHIQPTENQIESNIWKLKIPV